MRAITRFEKQGAEGMRAKGERIFGEGTTLDCKLEACRESSKSRIFGTGGGEKNLVESQMFEEDREKIVSGAAEPIPFSMPHAGKSTGVVRS